MRSLLAGSVSAALVTLGLVLTDGAGATQVAYSDGDQVWVSTLDGSSKRSLSGPSDSARQWREVAQADDGTIIGVRRNGSEIGTLNDTQLWNADGSVRGNGALSAKPGRSSYAYPVTLDLTPDGKGVVYGYANWSGYGLSTVYEFGTYAEGSTNWYIEPFDVTVVDSGTLAGNRIVGVSGTVIYLQNDATAAPYTTDFTPWFDAGPISSDVGHVDVSANGKIAAVETGPLATQRIAMIPFASLGGPLPADGSDCFLPAVGAARDVSISQDGTSMAWHDDRGVVVAGTPVWFPSATESICNLSRPAVVISATGKYPSLGPSTAATPAPPPTVGTGSTPPPGTIPPGTAPPSATPPGPRVAAAARVKASALATGLALGVTVARRGTVTVTAKVGGKTVATATAKATRAGVLKLRLKATKAYRRRLRSLRGKTLVITIKADGRTTTITRKLG